MSTRLLLEGEDLPALMARIRAEMGPGARIVKAEKVRTGGVAGFFAREHYELTIEVPDTEPFRRIPRPPRPASTTTAPVGLDALLAAADEAEQRQDADGGPGSGRGTSDASGGARSEVPVPKMSTSTPMFAEILASMQQVVGPPAAIEAGPAGDGDGTGSPVAGVDSTQEAGTPSAGEVVDDVPTDAVRVDATPVDSPPRAGSSAAALLELGVPTRLLAGIPAADAGTPLPLSVLVRRFDKPPSVRLLPGSVVAVVGTPDLALRTATQMAQRAGVDPSDVVLAGAMPAVPGHGRRLQTPGAIARLRSRVPEDVPTIVAIGAPEARPEWPLAAELLDALTPHQAWAVVDARRKTVDVRRWLRTVGMHRPFDALAACNTFEAQAPGTVLGLGTPVGWVDGLPATPVVWAAVLSERMADDARWD